MLTAACLLFLNSVTAKSRGIETGTGIVCNTAAQVEETIALWDSLGSRAIAKVNHDALSSACSVIGVAYYRGKTVKTVRNSEGKFDIVEITVVGSETPFGIMPLNPAIQFTTFRVAGHEI